MEKPYISQLRRVYEKVRTEVIVAAAPKWHSGLLLQLHLYCHLDRSKSYIAITSHQLRITPRDYDAE